MTVSVRSFGKLRMTKPPPCHSERSEESPMAKRYAKLDCHVASLLTMTVSVRSFDRLRVTVG